MQFNLRHIGSYGGKPSKIVELRIETHNVTITESITDNNGFVDENIIDNLQGILSELIEHNIELKNQNE